MRFADRANNRVNEDARTDDRHLNRFVVSSLVVYRRSSYLHYDRMYVIGASYEIDRRVKGNGRNEMISSEMVSNIIIFVRLFFSVCIYV